MAVYINEGYVPADGGKPWKHLDERCRLLQERAKAGFAVKRVRNVDNKKPLAQHVRRRCEVCFSDGQTLQPTGDPAWLLKAKSLETGKKPGTAWTYDLMHAAEKRAQVGMASNLYERLKSRWRATCMSRFGDDCIPWLHDLVATNRSDEIVLDARPYPSEGQARAAERELRERKRGDGWHVSSDV